MGRGLNLRVSGFLVLGGNWEWRILILDGLTEIPRLEDGKRRRRPGEGFLGVDSSKVVVVVGVVCVVGGSRARAQTRVKFQRQRGEKGGQRGLLGDSGPSGMETLPGNPCGILAASRQMDRQTGWRSPPGQSTSEVLPGA
jgi:hypothetical protein